MFASVEPVRIHLGVGSGSQQAFVKRVLGITDAARFWVPLFIFWACFRERVVTPGHKSFFTVDNSCFLKAPVNLPCAIHGEKIVRFVLGQDGAAAVVRHQVVKPNGLA